MLFSIMDRCDWRYGGFWRVRDFNNP